MCRYPPQVDNYTKQTVRLLMDGYVRQALLEFEHKVLSVAHYGAPSQQYMPPKYGSKVQFTNL